MVEWIDAIIRIEAILFVVIEIWAWMLSDCEEYPYDDEL